MYDTFLYFIKTHKIRAPRGVIMDQGGPQFLCYLEKFIINFMQANLKSIILLL